MSLAQYRPDESEQEIFSEHTWLQGAFLGCIAYGMEFILFTISFHLLWVSRHKGGNPKRNIGLIVYIVVLFLMGTLYIVALMQFTQQSFIDGRNIPGGPNAYENIEYSLPIDMLGNAMLVVVGWMCDIINVWRCYVIYKTCRVPAGVVIVLPCLVYLANMVLGILWLKQVGYTGASPWTPDGINFTVPFLTTSLALNIFVTLLIVGRLVLYQHRIKRVMGGTHGTQYLSLAAVIVESATVYSLFSLLFLIPFALSNTNTLAQSLSQIFLQPLSPVQIVSTYLIIFRVAQGKGWSPGTATMITDRSGNSAVTSSTGKFINNRIRIQTSSNTYTDMTHTGSDGSIALKHLSNLRSVEFEEPKVRGVEAV